MTYSFFVLAFCLPPELFYTFPVVCQYVVDDAFITLLMPSFFPPLSEHYSICPFIVILHISCSRLFILETLPLTLCSSPDSLGEILVIFQSAAAFMAYLSCLLYCAVMCPGCHITGEATLLEVTHFSLPDVKCCTSKPH